MFCKFTKKKIIDLEQAFEREFAKGRRIKGERLLQIIAEVFEMPRGFKGTFVRDVAEVHGLQKTMSKGCSYYIRRKENENNQDNGSG